MKPSIYRRVRRRSASHEAINTNKESKQEQQFFGETMHEPFFKPATALQQGASVNRKCADCEGEEKVQRAPEKKKEEKVMKKEEKKEEKLQRAPEKKEEEKVMKKEEKKEEKLQRATGKKEEEKKVQRATDKKEEEKVMKKEEKKEEEKVHKKESVSSPANSTATASNYIGSINGKGQSMGAGVQSFYESRIGGDFSDVKIHTGKEAADSAKDINAQAYAYGNHIVFNEGKYQPETSEGKHLLAHELAHVVQQSDKEQKNIDRFAITSADKVRSLEVEKAEVDFAAKGAVAIKRDGVVSKRFTEIRKGKISAKEKTAVDNIDKRWDTVINNISATGGIIDVKTLHKEFAGIRTNLTADKADTTNITNKNVLDAIEKFHEIMESIVNLGEKINDEFYTVGSAVVPEFFRFDTDFKSADTAKVIATIKGATFNEADVKALIGTETGDLTNTGVDGIKGKTKGLTSFRNNSGHIGLGQQTTVAASEGETKVTAAGASLSSAADHRKNPSDSIKLTAGFMARLADILIGCLPTPVPTSDEFKKLVFAGYNGGHDGVCNAADDFVKRNGAKNYKWNDIKDFATTKVKKRIKGKDVTVKINGVTSQMRNYVIDTVKRLS